MKLFNGLIVSGLSVRRQCPTWRSEVFLSHMTHGSLFSGIGGFELAAQWMGWDNKFHCEWNEFGQKVLHHYWPDAELFTDITKSDFKKYHGTIDIISGGFPCQPYSMAGKRLGKEDDRHLWPEMLRVIRQVRPRWVVGENVLGLVNWNGGLVFHEVQTDLEAEGYEVQPYVLPAAAVGAPHRRDRVWFVAKNTMRSRCIHGEIKQEGAEIREQWDISAGSAERIYLSERNAANTDIRSKESPREGGSLERSGSENNDEPGQWGGKAEQHTGRLNVQRNAANTDLHGRNERNGKHEEQSGERGVNAFRDIESGHVYGDAADTKRERYARPNNSRRKSFINGQDTQIRGGFAGHNQTNNWAKFPSVSPICGGNDGLPNQLDGITFSKWRNESIKAYGNAVVPQVVYQIFKAIEEYENMKK
jgi:DNA (cytosine-5)-methyltransferase 1